MMSVARWSLRLPRALGTTKAHCAIQRTQFTHHTTALLTPRQRRDLQSPPPRSRPWASKPENDHNSGNSSNNTTKVSTALAQTPTPDLTSSVHIPNDPNGVLPPAHPALSILGNSSLVIQRQIEMMNIFLGFEQANRYSIMDGEGQTLGYIAEQVRKMMNRSYRNTWLTHRFCRTTAWAARLVDKSLRPTGVSRR